MHTQHQQQSSAIASAVSEAFPDHLPRPVVFTVAQFAERNPAFTAPALRNLIFKADTRQSSQGAIPGNGLIEAGAVLRLGRKVLIHETRFFVWLEGQQ